MSSYDDQEAAAADEIPSSLNPQGLSGPSAVKNSRIYSRDPVLWFMFIAFSFVAYVFYNTEFRDVLEDWFFDVRTRWAPEYQFENDVVVLGISEQSLEVLDATQPRTLYDAKNKPHLSIEALTRVTGILSNSEATSINILLPNHSFPHSDERLREFIDIVRYDQRMLVGTTEYNRLVPSVVQIPYPLAEIRDRVYGYETFRKRSNVVVRKLPAVGFRGLSEELMLPVKIASQLLGTYGEISNSYVLNQVHPQRFPLIDASVAEVDPRKLQDQVRGKVVVFGYTINREIPFQTTDMMLVNTPLVGNEQNVENGTPLTFLVANAVENLVHGRTIKPLDPVFNFVQTIAVATLCGLAWELGSFTASTVTVLLWFFLVYLHAVGFSYGNVSIPLADTFLVSALTSIFAAVRRLKSELREMAGKQAIADAKSEIARVQSYFLSDFSSWLKSMTTIIVNEIRATQQMIVSANPKTIDVYQRAFSAGEEFNEYLESIRQIPELENVSKRLQRTEIDLNEFLSKVVRRFAVKIQERRLSVVLEVPVDAGTVRANTNLLDAIVFNFLSNAVKYAPEGSTITLRSNREKDRKIIVSVVDDGPGIPEELRERIFEKFYRIQDERLYKAKGTGLGLYLCRFFAERMGGRVDVIPHLPQGSEFRVILP